MLLDIPRDLQFSIFSLLDLTEVARLRQTCSALNNAISDDKQLWLHIFYRDITSCKLPSPPESVRPLTAVTAQNVKEWVNNGIILSRNYLTGKNEGIARFDTSMHVTWVKLVRGRWLLVACSDLQLSKLIVWDLHNLPSAICKATFHFTGPVTEALLEDDGFEILIAFTMGRRRHDTLLCALFVYGNEVRLRRICELAGYAFARFIRRPFIGFAARNDDDSCPYVLNWEIGSMRALIPPESIFVTDEETPGWVGHEPCAGMFLWKGYTFVLYPHELVIYEDHLPHDQPSDCPLFHVARVRLDRNVLWGHISALIVADETQVDNFSTANDLHILTRSGSGRISAYMIHYTHALDPSERFILRNTGFFRICEIPGRMLQTTKLSIGPSCRQSIIHALEHPEWHRSSLYTSPIIKHDGGFDFGAPVSIDISGLPLLFEMTSMDFDDGLGILVFGMRSGEVFIRTFGDEIPLTCLKSDLPVPDAPSDFCEQVPLDLPLTYRLPDSSCLEAYREKVMEITRTWQDETSAPQMPGWSSDWSKFDNISQWIMPYPRWGLLDRLYAEKRTCSRVRLRLGTLSDIIPVMYDEANHFRILFRIGDRLYYCRSPKPVTDYNAWQVDSDEDFAEHPHDDILGLLSISYSQLLVSDVQAFEIAVSDYWTQRNIDVSFSMDGDKHSLDRIRMYSRLKDAFVRHCGKYPGDEILKTWTANDWNAMRSWSAGFNAPYIASRYRDELLLNLEENDPPPSLS